MDRIKLFIGESDAKKALSQQKDIKDGVHWVVCKDYVAVLENLQENGWADVKEIYPRSQARQQETLNTNPGIILDNEGRKIQVTCGGRTV